MTKNDVLKCPQEFLYIFASEQFLATLPKRSAKIIRAKKQNQYYLLRNVVCGGDNAKMTELAAQISTKLKDAFGYSPLMILQKLKDGEAVAGKDWVNGVYGLGGVGSVQNSYAMNRNVTVDPTTGKLLAEGVEMQIQTMRTSNNGKTVTGYTAVYNGVTYNSFLNKDGKYYAENCTDANGQTYTPSGNLTGLAGFQSIWSSIQGYLTLFNEIITFLKEMFPSLFNRTSLLTTSNTAITPSDWNQKTTDWTTYALFGGVAAALYYYFNKGKK